jgi:hypothetical protein
VESHIKSKEHPANVLHWKSAQRTQPTIEAVTTAALVQKEKVCGRPCARHLLCNARPLINHALCGRRS